MFIHIPQRKPMQAIQIDTIPDMSENAPIGREFNLILLVKDNAPKRIKYITQQVSEMEQKLKDLQHEKHQLQRMLDVLEETV